MNGTTAEDSEFLSPKDKDLLKKGSLKDFSELDQEVFFHYVEKTRLDPFTRQIYATSRVARSEDDDSSSKGPNPLTIVTGIGGFLWVAERTGKYDGDDAPQWCGIDAKWLDVWTDVNVPPSACRVTTHRKDRTHPSTAVVNWKAVAQYKRKWVAGRPTNDYRPTVFWEKGGPGQLAKCALAASLRKLFPSQLAGVYIDDEIGDELPVEQIDAKTEGINEAAAFADRAKVSEELLKAERPNGTHANLVVHSTPPAEVKPEDMEDALAPAPADPPAVDWWNQHRIELITKAAFKGKLVGDLDTLAVEAAVDKWVPRVPLRSTIDTQLRKVLPAWVPKLDPAYSGEAFQLTAEALVLRFLDDISKKAKEASL